MVDKRALALPVGITRANFEERAAKWGAAKGYKDNWPFLSRNPEVPGVGAEADWVHYFNHHLGGFPKAFRLFMQGRIRYYNLPEIRPEQFDPSYSSGDFRPLPTTTASRRDYSPEHRARMAALFEQLLDDLRSGRLKKDSGIQGPAPVGAVFSNYDEAVRRHSPPRSYFSQQRKKEVMQRGQRTQLDMSPPAPDVGRSARADDEDIVF